MLVTAAVLPHPPLLVPEVASGAAGELDELRAACHKAVDSVVASDVDRLVVVGGAKRRASFGPGARGSLSGFGVPVEVAVPGAPPTGGPVLPLSATIGCWLLSHSHPACPVVVEVVAGSASPRDADALGVELAASAARVGLLVMGDGAATLSPKAPGYVVDGADQWRRDVDQMLGSAVVEAVAALSTDDADRFAAGGRAPWQVLAGAARGSTWRGTLLAAEAPYGVGYTVATWQRGTE
jgi:hypothetical protein